MEERKVRVLISFALEQELVQQIEDVDARIDVLYLLHQLRLQREADQYAHLAFLHLFLLTTED